MKFLTLEQVKQLQQYRRLLTQEEEFENVVTKVCNRIYTQKELLTLLDISPNTLKKYRDSGYIAYSKVDDKYFYSKKDVDEFLENTHIPAWKFNN